jgi:hypothetical protein
MEATNEWREAFLGLCDQHRASMKAVMDAMDAVMAYPVVGNRLRERILCLIDTRTATPAALWAMLEESRAEA